MGKLSVFGNKGQQLHPRGDQTRTDRTAGRGIQGIYLELDLDPVRPSIDVYTRMQTDRRADEQVMIHYEGDNIDSLLSECAKAVRNELEEDRDWAVKSNPRPDEEYMLFHALVWNRDQYLASPSLSGTPLDKYSNVLFEQTAEMSHQTGGSTQHQKGKGRPRSTEEQTIDLVTELDEPLIVQAEDYKTLAGLAHKFAISGRKIIVAESGISRDGNVILEYDQRANYITIPSQTKSLLERLEEHARQPYYNRLESVVETLKGLNAPFEEVLDHTTHYYSDKWTSYQRNLKKEGIRKGKQEGRRIGRQEQKDKIQNLERKLQKARKKRGRKSSSPSKISFGILGLTFLFLGWSIGLVVGVPPVPAVPNPIDGGQPIDGQATTKSGAILVNGTASGNTTLTLDLLDAKNQPVRTKNLTTDKTGNFSYRFSNLSNGTYKVHIQGPTSNITTKSVNVTTSSEPTPTRESTPTSSPQPTSTPTPSQNQ